MNFSIFTDEIILYFLVFCRVGMAMMILPAFGTSYVTPRARLFMALTVSLMFATLLTDQKPELSNSPVGILVAVFSELTVGFMIGSLAKIIASALHTAGMIMSMQSALAQAVLFDPGQGAQGALFGNFLEVTALALMFALNLHHLLLLAVGGTYEIYPIGAMPDFGAIADAAATTLTKSFYVAFQLSAPIVVVGLVINLASGLLARLMPAFQVFFVIMPAQIMISFFIFAATFSVVMMWYMNYLETSFTQFLK